MTATERPDYQLLIGAGWLPAVGGQTYDSDNPYTGEPWATVADAGVADVDAAVEAARQAPTLATRSQRIAEADAAVNEDVPFIPLARPLRWSLVAARLAQWQANSRAWHPLNQLRTDTN